jgi:hypothetical protein
MCANLLLRGLSQKAKGQTSALSTMNFSCQAIFCVWNVAETEIVSTTPAFFG